MKKPVHALGMACAISVVLAACKQPPSEVVEKGDYHFTRYASALSINAPVETQYKSAQSAQSVQVAPIYAAAPVAHIETQTIGVRNISSRNTTQSAPQIAQTQTIVKPLAAQQTEQKSFRDVIAKREVTAMASVKPVAVTDSTAPATFAKRLETREGFIWPVRGKLISTFGDKKNGEKNDGINISAMSEAEVKAVADGKVIYAGNELPAYGNMVIVKHNNGWISAYAHLNSFSVGIDSDVRQGQMLGRVGNTGAVKLSQLHFGLRKDMHPVNPLDFLGEVVASN